MSAPRNLREEVLTQAHFMALFGHEFDAPFHGIAFFWCDKLAGFGGVALHDGQWVAFSDIAKGVTVPDIAIWRCARRVMKEIVSVMEGPVFAGVAPESSKWARLLGFRQLQGEIFVWEQD